MITDKEILEAGYISTGKKDIHGVTIFEGSIIGADGYNSDLEKLYFHCVEYDPDTGEFTSDIYGDNDPLSMYNKIIVFGHALEYKHLNDNNTDMFEWGGNLGAVFEPATNFYNRLNEKYHSVGEEKLSNLMWEFIKSEGLRYKWDRYFEENHKKQIN